MYVHSGHPVGFREFVSDRSMLPLPRPRGPDASTVAVLVGTTSPALRAGLQAIIDGVSTLRMESSADTMKAILAHVETAGECIVLMDMDAGQGDLRELLQSFRRCAPRVRVVLIADHVSAYQVRLAIQSGALGFLEKTASTEEIRSALVSVARGIRYLTPALSCRLAESVLLPELTRREMDVLDKISRGVCSKLIARELGIAEGTVKTHVCSLLDKFDARSRMDVVLKAARLGIVRLQ